MANSVLILGLGTLGCRALDSFLQKRKQENDAADGCIVSVAIDREYPLQDVKFCDAALPLCFSCSIQQAKVHLGKAAWEDFFPSGILYDHHDSDHHYPGWRKGAYLYLLDMLGNACRSELDRALERLKPDGEAPSIQIYVVTSLEGSTGTGIFLPLSLYVKKRLSRMFPHAALRSHAFLVTPDVHRLCAEENAFRSRTLSANLYAAVRELNAVCRVAYGGADGCAAPANFRIGAPESPTGVLFDASDPAYRRPEAAPFDTVSFLPMTASGRDPFLACTEMVAETLYSLISVRESGESKSAASPIAGRTLSAEELPRVYSLLSSVTVEYPAEEMIDYFAWRKTYEDVGGDLLVLHRAMQAAIQERKKQMFAMRRHFYLTDADYAELYLAQRAAEADARTSGITDIIDGATLRYENDGKSELPVSLIEEYGERITRHLRALLPDVGQYFDRVLADGVIVQNPGLFQRKRRGLCARAVIENAELCLQTVSQYYRDALAVIHEKRDVLADAILPMTRESDPMVNAELSFVASILMRNGTYIHPVAALVQLCHFYKQIHARLSALCVSYREEINAPELGDIPPARFACVADVARLALGKRAKKSAYLAMGESRLAMLVSEEGRRSYASLRTDYETDSNALYRDSKLILDRLAYEAECILLREVLSRVEKRVGMLIEGYRGLFDLITEKGRGLERRLLRAEAEKSKPTDGARIYVGASVERRQAHYEAMLAEDTLDPAAYHGALGRGFFRMVYEHACECGDGKAPKEHLDALPVIDLMYEENRRQIASTPYCMAMRSKSVLCAVVEESSQAPRTALAEVLDRAKRLATPPSDCFASQTALCGLLLLPDASAEAYLKKNRSLFGISETAAEPLSSALLGDILPDATVLAGKSTHGVIRLTGVVTALALHELTAFNETAENGLYEQYLLALQAAEDNNYDVWNPHIGLDWHKPGVLPFIAPDKEAEPPCAPTDGTADTAIAPEERTDT